MDNVVFIAQDEVKFVKKITEKVDFLGQGGKSPKNGTKYHSVTAKPPDILRPDKIWLPEPIGKEFGPKLGREKAKIQEASKMAKLPFSCAFFRLGF